MNENLHDIDNFFNKHLKGYEDDPGKEVWLAIENNLNSKDAFRYKRRYTVLLKALSCGVLLIMSLLVSDILRTPSFKVKENNSVIEDSASNQLNTKQVTIKQGNIKRNSERGIYKTPIFINTPESNIYETPKQRNELLPDAIVTDYLPAAAMALHKEVLALITNSLIFKTPFLIKQLHQKQTETNSLTDREKKKLQANGSKHNFAITPFYSYDFVSQHLQEVYLYDNQNRVDVANREKADPSFTIGILAEQGLSKRLQIQSGISMSTSFTSVAPTVVRAVKDNTSGTYKFKLATSYGLAEIKKTGIANPETGDSILVKDATIRLQYITLPIVMKYQIKKGKVDINTLAGIGINKMVNEKMEVEYTANTNTLEKIEKIEGLKKTFLTTIAGAEATYNINKKISVGVSPTLRYSLTPVNKGTPVKTYPVTVGIGGFIKIKL